MAKGGKPSIAGNIKGKIKIISRKAPTALPT